MSNGFIYVVDAHFIDIILKKKSWTQVPVIWHYTKVNIHLFFVYLMCCFGNNPFYMDFTPIKIMFCSVLFILDTSKKYVDFPRLFKSMILR